ncbi:Beta-propeller repeat protein [compost metagenome]
MIPAVSGTYFGKAMTAGHVYNLDIGTDNASPKHLALLPNGEIYFYTPENVPYVGTRCFVRKIALDGSISDVLMDETAFSIATDPAGNLYIRTAHKVEMVPAANGTYFGKAMTAGNRYTIAGNGSSGADTGIATGATLQGLPSIAFDADGNLYATMSNSPYQIRMVPNVAGTYFGQAMNVGEIYPIATVQNNTTKSLTLDSLGNVYAWTSSGNKIVRISPNGQVSPFAGGGAGGEGGLAKKAALLAPTTMTFGPDGSLYFLRDSRVMRIR